MPKPLRLALLGTGIAARQLYLPAFQALKRRVEVVACASRSRQSAEEFARLAGIPKVASTARELVALPEVEAVFISLPIAAQPAAVLAALQAGKPVLSEKPVGPSVVEAQRLIDEAQRIPVPWLIAENYAFSPTFHRVLGWLATERLGALRLAAARQITTMDPENPFFHTAWRTSPEFVGGFVVDAGVHLAHWLRRCCGIPQRIRGATAAFDPAKPPLDSAVATMEFDSGVLGTWISCFSARYSGPELELFGSEGVVRLSLEEATLVPRRGRPLHYRASRSTIELELAHFADVVKRGATPVVTPADALADLAIIEAIAKARE
ncbi:MAG: Gfo/Idh/MocA family oxidoreductase [Polyangiaceae bacterium]|nr:Gfo/Idh/MocA family oxidoreductase [Polyangiaceae bacterium]